MSRRSVGRSARTSPFRLLPLISLTALLVCAPAFAAERTKDPAAPTDGISQNLPVTNEVLRQWLAQTDLGRMLRRDAASLVTRTLPGGAVALDMGDGYRNVLVAQVAPGGEAVVSCIASEKQAEQILTSIDKIADTPKEP